MPLVVLGCRLVWGSDGRLSGALGRRVQAARLASTKGGNWLVVSGGRTWAGVVEADAMRDQLMRDGVAGGAVVRERCSLTTRDNARMTADLLRRFGVTRVRLVTCAWHMPRAALLFAGEGLVVDALPVAAPPMERTRACWRDGREWAAMLLEKCRRVAW